MTGPPRWAESSSASKSIRARAEAHQLARRAEHQFAFRTEVGNDHRLAQRHGPVEIVGRGKVGVMVVPDGEEGDVPVGPRP